VKVGPVLSPGRASFGAPARARKGFSLIEIAVTLLLLATVATLTWSASQLVRSSGSAAGAAPLLATVQVQARRLVGVDGRYPADLVSQLAGLSVPGLAVTTQGATADNDVSAYRSSEYALVLAAVSGVDCLVLVDRLDGSSSWIRIREAADSCSASVLQATALALPAAGTSDAPQQVES
jgi:prepilin-type N-terminal cleavage/methylation domain-containing protein